MPTTVFYVDNEKINKPTSLNTAVASNETLSSCYKRAAFVGFYFFIGNGCLSDARGTFIYMYKINTKYSTWS